MDNWTCVNNEEQISQVSIIHNSTVCDMQGNLCTTTIYRSAEMTVNILLADDHLMTIWHVSKLGPDVYGFRVVCMDPDHNHPNDKVLHTSPLLEKSLRSYIAHGFDDENAYTVCVEVIGYSMQTVEKVCKTVYPKGSSALVGVLAGCVFITPSIVFLVWFFFKDRSMSLRVHPNDNDLCKLVCCDIDNPKAEHTGQRNEVWVKCPIRSSPIFSDKDTATVSLLRTQSPKMSDHPIQEQLSYPSIREMSSVQITMNGSESRESSPDSHRAECHHTGVNRLLESVI